MLKRFARRALGCLCICLIGIAILMLLGAWLIKREIPIAIANGIKESTDWTLAYDKVETRLLDLAFEAKGGTLTSGDPAKPRVTIDIGSARLDLRHDGGDRLAIEEFDLRIAAIHLPSTDGTALDRLYEGLMPTFASSSTGSTPPRAATRPCRPDATISPSGRSSCPPPRKANAGSP